MSHVRREAEAWEVASEQVESSTSSTILYNDIVALINPSGIGCIL
jgi:hypothetical protein